MLEVNLDNNNKKRTKWIFRFVHWQCAQYTLCIWCAQPCFNMSPVHCSLSLPLSLAFVLKRIPSAQNRWGERGKPLSTFGKNEIGHELIQHSILLSGILYCISIELCVRSTYTVPHLPHWITKLQVDFGTVMHAYAM